MSLTQYLSAIVDPCLALFCGLAALNIIVTKQDDPRSARFLAGILFTCLLLNMQEVLAYFQYGDSSDKAFILVRIATFSIFFFLFVLIALETGYLWRRTELRGGATSRRLMTATLVFCGAGIVGTVCSAFAPIFYDFDDQNSFITGKFYWAFMAVIGLALLPLLIQTVLNRRVFLSREYRAFLCLFLLPVAASIFQNMMMWKFSMYSLAVSISVLIVFSVYRRESSGFTIIREKVELSNENIFQVFEDLERFMKSFDMEERNRFKVRMTVEEVLIRLQERFGKEDTFNIFALVYFGRPQIRIEKEGELFNPLSKEETGFINWSGSMLTSIGLNPVFSYAGRKNILKLPLERLQMNPSLKMFIALFIGIIAGGVGVNALSAADQLFVIDEVLQPVYDVLRNLLYCVTGPILFLMVITVILDTAGISEQGGNSRNIVGRYLSLSFVMGLAPLAVIILMMGNDLKGFNLGRNDADTLIDGLLSIVPKDVFSPFVQANTPQLMTMAIMAGLAIAVLGSKARGLSDTIKQANLAGMQMAQWIGSIIPYVSIATAALIYMRGHMIDLVFLTPVLFGSVGISLLCMAAVMMYISVKEKVRPMILIKKCWPSFINSLKSGSLDTSYGLSERCCTRGLGIERHFAGVGLPLGLVMYMPANVVGTLMFIMYAAVRSNVSLSPLWMLLSVALAVILFVATPPIPGANFLAYIVMISMLGINEDYLMLALIYEIIYGSFASSANQFFVQLELVLQAEKMGLLKKATLQREMR